MARRHTYDGTPMRPIRLDDELWTTAIAVARLRGETASGVARAALQRYVQRWKHLLPPGWSWQEAMQKDQRK